MEYHIQHKLVSVIFLNLFLFMLQSCYNSFLEGFTGFKLNNLKLFFIICGNAFGGNFLLVDVILFVTCALISTMSEMISILSLYSKTKY